MNPLERVRACTGFQWDEGNSTKNQRKHRVSRFEAEEVPSVRTISLRLPEAMLEALKVLVNKQDVPHQSLIKVFLSERRDAENKKNAP